MTVSSGALLSDALVHSPIVAGEDGSGAPPASMAGYEFGVDPNIDPELALVSVANIVNKQVFQLLVVIF